MIRSSLQVLLLVSLFATAATAQQPVPAKPKGADPVEKLGENLFRVGNVRVDTAKHEASITGTVTSALSLEFVLCTKGGAKAYESAIEMDTDAVMFNMALILIGLDKANGVPTKMHFDPNPPQGDPVEIWVEWGPKEAHHKMHAEELVWDSYRNAPLAPGQWVYTGSVILDDGRYLADLDGVLVGFVHTPAPVIERTTFEKVAYGGVHLNPNIGLAPGTVVTVTVKAVAKSAAEKKRNGQ